MKVLSKLTGAGSSSSPPPPPPATAGISVGTASVDVRLGFLRKVYLLLSINFGITIGISCLFTFIRPIRNYVLRNWWVFIVALVVSFVLLIVLSCVKLKYPLNIIVMYCFVLALSSFVGIVVARYYAQGAGMIVLQAFIATAAVFLTITFYVGITKKDFNFLYGFLAAGSLILIILIIFNFVLSALFVRGKVSKAVSFGISIAGALLMTGYLLYDTSLVINRFGPDQWLEAVLALYVDVTNLFLFFLNIFSFINN